MPTTKGHRMKPWNQITHYAGFDWAKDHHDVVVVDAQGQIVASFQFEHTQVGWQQFRQKIKPYPGLAVAIETSQGAAIDQLLQCDCTVYPLNPLSAKAYCDRKAPSGNKTDRNDAWAFGDALRVDGQHWPALKPLDPLTQQLRLICRDEMQLIEERTALVNRLQQALSEYYPAALEAFDDWTQSYCWEFIVQFPTPQALVKAKKGRWNRFLHTHKLWRPETTAKRIAIFQHADHFCGSAAITSAKSLLAVSLAKTLCVLEDQLDIYRKQIRQLFNEHPDHDIFGSLPGAADKLAPRLLAEIGGDPQRYPDTTTLQCFAGTAPVSYQSGQIHKVHLRRQCNKVLRYIVHLWSNSSRLKTLWAQTYYDKKRAEGKSHACALRCLGQRLLKILWKMIQTRTAYDAELHAKNQKAHGSWVLSLIPQKSA
jgi:transposase